MTNWFHPLGFAYGPDGVYRDNPELEKGEKNPLGVVDCDAKPDNAAPFCDFPQYKLNGKNLCSDPEDCFADFGLDEYEGVHFSGGRADWIDAGEFTVELKVTDPATVELFYFCHIHEDMSARIKVLDEEGNPLQEQDLIPIPYTYDVNDAFDTECGTTNTSQYSDIERVCPQMTFLCGSESSFDKCMNAIDCGMHVEMRVETDSSNPVVTFMHQMIAHHRNAVNMAKILLKENPPALDCGTNYDGRRRLPAEQRRSLQQLCADTGEDGGRPAETLLWEIINGQNAQITFMRSWLADNAHDEFANCKANTEDPATPALIAGTVLSVIGAIALAVAVLVTCRFNKQMNNFAKANADAEKPSDKPSSGAQPTDKPTSGTRSVQETQVERQ